MQKNNTPTLQAAMSPSIPEGVQQSQEAICSETKNRRVQLLLTQAAYQKGKEAADAAGISFNEYINSLIMGSADKEKAAEKKAAKEKRLDPLRLYTLGEAGEVLQVCSRTLHRYIKSGKLKATKVGGSWKVTAKDIEDYIATQRN